MHIKNILQMGTTNWQILSEPAPGSGILHEAHHRELIKMGYRSFSLFPTCKKGHEESDFVKPLYLDHDIPVFTRIPTSSYQFSDMRDDTFNAYIDRLKFHTLQYIQDIEAKYGCISAAISHHIFINLLILKRINEHRMQENMPRIPIFAFGHGTALKMFTHEVKIEHPRFLSLIQSVISEVDGVFVISSQQKKRFIKLFPEYPAHKIFQVKNGVDTEEFYPIPHLNRQMVLRELNIDENPDYLITYVGKFAEWKRIDMILHAATHYETWHATRDKSIMTLIVGTGTEMQVEHYHTMAQHLNLQGVRFVGARLHQEIMRIFNVSDLGVFPSYKEPFGLVFLECMACGTPVIGAKSGGPKDFVNEKVGFLIKETHEISMSKSLAEAIFKATIEDWKASKGKAGQELVHSEYTWRNQVSNMLEIMANICDSDENLCL